MRLPFDIYEQAKLTETYMMMKDRLPSEWKVDIENLSDMLRHYAELRGIEIDEKYRNVAGITLQIRAFDFVATNGKRGLNSASDWMRDMLSLCQNHPEDFQELLQEANRLMGQPPVGVQVPSENLVEHTPTEGLNSLRAVSHQPYENISEEEVWDKNMLAETVETYYRMKERPNSEWDECGQNLADRLGDYVRHYRPSLLDQMSYDEAAAKIASVHMMFQEYGYVREDYSLMDLQMFRMRQMQPERFREYLTDFEICLSSESEEQGVTDVDEGDAALDRYETAKLVELCSRPYKNKDMRELVQQMQSYAKKRGIEDEEGLRSVYQLNRRTSYIFRLLSPGNGEKQGTLPLEREIVNMYLERPQDFSALIVEANLRMDIEVNLFMDDGEHCSVGKAKDSLHRTQSDFGIDGLRRTLDLITKSNHYKDSEEEMDREIIAESGAGFTDSLHLCCCAVLKDFPNGIDVNSPLDTDRFCLKYEEIYGSLPDSGEEGLMKILQQVGEKHDGRIFPAASREKKELLQEIKATAMGILAEGYSCVYIEQLYVKYRDELGKEAVYSMEDLKNLLQPTAADTYIISANRMVKTDKKADIGEDVLSFLKLQGEPTTITVIEHDLWHIPLPQIKQAINQNPGIINTAHQTFMAAEIFPVSQEDLEQISCLLNEELGLSSNGQLTDEDLRSLVEKELPHLAIDTQEYTLKAFHGALGYWLDYMKRKFYFVGHYVAKSQENLQSASENFCQFCDDREHFTLEELSDFAKEINVYSNLWYYYDDIRKVSLRLNQDEFIKKDFVKFDVDAIDAKLEMFCPGDYAPLKTVKNFMLLPMVEGFSWDYFLLESYVHSVSQKFYLSLVRFLDSEIAGAMVRRNTSFADYDAVLSDALAHYDGWTSDVEALEFLVDEGYLARNRYGKIGEICKRARKIKENLEQVSYILPEPVNQKKNITNYYQQNYEAEKPVDENRVIFGCTRKNVDATAYISPNGFTVRKGSRISDDVGSSGEKNYGSLRKQLESNGTIIDGIFQRDFEFDSPSAAACVVLGRSANGNIEWKAEDGRLFGDFGIKIQWGKVIVSQKNTKKNFNES